MNMHLSANECLPQTEADWIDQALDWLAPQDAPTALDVSAGLGRAAAALAKRGPQVLALTSADHLNRCRQNYPTLRFAAGNPAHFALHQGRKAVFSWMACAQLQPEEGPAAFRCLAKACASGGRLVIECAANGHQATLEKAFAQVMAEHGFPLPEKRWRPSLGQAVCLLEEEGLTVDIAAQLSCPTLFSGRDLLTAHLLLEEETALAGIDDQLVKEAILNQTIERVHPAFYHPQGYVTDAVHLRLCAHR